ncbi:MAG: DUF2442 domain-containing protein [Bacteroidales bacterium]|jgi:hypothetical protein|nr:DUF2442 domain-containing protein [Bacteroidales bacterium]MCR4873818.1 DUF2442 domain-containing protein [Bacteroidales bacterium]
MIPRIKTVTALDDYMLRIVFDDGEIMLYDVKDDIAHIKAFKELETEEGLWGKVRLDTSRTCVYWNDRIDLPSDTLYEYGQSDFCGHMVAEDAPRYNEEQSIKKQQKDL